jgi:hypothetical protein
MKRKLLIAMVALFGSYQANAQSAEVTAGMGIIGPACTNCGLLTGVQSSGSYAILDKITVGASFSYYWDKEVISGYTYSDKAINAGAFARWYPKEKFKGFYIGPDMGYITLTETYGATETKLSNITFGASLGWDINIADLVIINPFMGYGTWFEGSKGRVEMGLRIGAKF